jgi:predicted nucleic acid-binding protein
VIVVDASAALELLLRTKRAARIEARLLAPGETLHAPHLLDVEVAQVVRRYWRSGEIDADRGRQALSDLLDLPIARYPHDVLLRRVWELRQNVTAYDAAYLALAEALGARLLTCDARLAAAPGHRARVELIA